MSSRRHESSRVPKERDTGTGRDNSTEGPRERGDAGPNRSEAGDMGKLLGTPASSRTAENQREDELSAGLEESNNGEKKLRAKGGVGEEQGKERENRKARGKLSEDVKMTEPGSADGGDHASVRENVVGSKRSGRTNPRNASSSGLRSESSDQEETNDDRIRESDPASPSSSAVISAASCVEEKLFLLFKLLGQLAAKALLDGRSHCIDLRLHPSFWRLVLQSDVHCCRCVWRRLDGGSVVGQDSVRKQKGSREERENDAGESGIRSGHLQQEEEQASSPRRCLSFGTYDQGIEDKEGTRGSPSGTEATLRRGAVTEERTGRDVGETRLALGKEKENRAALTGGEQILRTGSCTACLRLEALGLVDLMEIDEQLARGLQHMLKMRSEGSDVSQLACVFVLPGESC